MNGYGNRGFYPENNEELMKLDEMIKEEEANIEDYHKRIGKLYALLHADDEVFEADFLPLMTVLRMSNERIKAMKNRQLEINGVSFGDKDTYGQSGEGSVYEAEASAENAVRCPECGAVIEENAMFCTECGKPVVRDDADTSEDRADADAGVAGEFAVPAYEDIIKMTAESDNASLGENKQLGDSSDAVPLESAPETVVSDVVEAPVAEFESAPAMEMPMSAMAEPEAVAEEMVADTKICAYCGAEIPADSLFCTECGKPVVSIEAETVAEEAPIEAPVAEFESVPAMEMPMPAMVEHEAVAEEMVADTKICAYCGTELPADSLFCTECGKPVVSVEAETVVEGAPAAPLESAPETPIFGAMNAASAHESPGSMTSAYGRPTATFGRFEPSSSEYGNPSPYGSPAYDNGPRCSNCGKPLLNGANACDNCGKPVFVPLQMPGNNKCHRCGAKLRGNLMYCVKCGAKLY